MNNKNFVIVGTKGGSGKSIVATMVVPVFFAGSDRKITIYSIDENNIIKVKSDFIKFKDLKLKDAENIIDEVEIARISENDDISIIDAGGGFDSLSLLKSIKKTEVKGLIYIIPIADDIEQIYNLTHTIKAIKDASPDAVIYLILNRVNEMNEDKIKEQFIGIYGSTKYGINPIEDEIMKQIDGIYFLENSPIFSILKNIYQTSLLDSYLHSVDLLDDLENKKREWVTKGSEYFKKQNSMVRLSKDVINLIKNVHNMKTMIEG